MTGHIHLYKLLEILSMTTTSITVQWDLEVILDGLYVWRTNIPDSYTNHVMSYWRVITERHIDSMSQELPICTDGLPHLPLSDCMQERLKLKMF